LVEFISAAHVPNEDSAISFEFPNRCIGRSRHAPFSNDAAVSAAGYREQQGR